MNENVTLSYFKGGKHKEEVKQRWQLVQSHTARRTFATLAYERGTPLAAIRAITGHADDKMLLKYIKTSQAKQVDIFDEFNKL